MNNRAESIMVMYQLFQTGEGGSLPTSALQMRVERIDWQTAKDCNRAWHSRLPRIGDPKGTEKAMLFYGAIHGGRCYAVAIWSHPVNRHLPQVEWLELRRMAICKDAPKNTGSWMLGVMARMIRKHKPEVVNLISYQDESAHAGTIYRAAGWIPTVRTNYKPWTNNSRSRPQDQSNGAKQRWEKKI